MLQIYNLYMCIKFIASEPVSSSPHIILPPGSEGMRQEHPGTRGYHQTDPVDTGMQTPSLSGCQHLRSLRKGRTLSGQECV